MEKQSFNRYAIAVPDFLFIVYTFQTTASSIETTAQGVAVVIGLRVWRRWRLMA